MKIKKGVLFVLFFLALATSVYANNYEFNSNNSYGIFVFSNTSTSASIPQYSIWNNSLQNFTAKLPTVDLQTNNDANWLRIKSNHEREEFILITLTDSLNKYVEVYNGSAWGNNLTLGTSSSRSDRRDFDVAYEQISGNALIVYENESLLTNSFLRYRIWNGTDYTTPPQTLSTGLGNGVFRFIKLIPKINSNDIMIAGLNSNNDIFAALWNGSEFNNATTITLNAATPNGFIFDFSWESVSGEGILVYGLSGSEVYFRGYGGSWGAETLLQETSGAQEPTSIKTCSDPTSDYIGIMAVDGGNDLNITIWGGSGLITNNQPIEHLDLEPTANPERLIIDCAWNSTGGAIFGFINNNNALDDSISYVTYDRLSWSVSNLANANTTLALSVNGGPLESLEFIKNQVHNSLFALTSTNDVDNTLRAIRYLENSTWDSQFYELTRDSFCANSANCLAFDWYNYDPSPNVTRLTLNQSSYNINQLVGINVTIVDNINISTVFANITLPNGSISILTLFDKNTDNVYNGNFSTTNLNGQYRLQIIANDTSMHSNYNNSVNITINVGDFIFPNVTFIQPPNATATFPINSTITLRVNVSDDIRIDSVLANITLPNGSISSLLFYNLTNKENLTVTFEQNQTTTNLIGSYAIRIIVNDTSNNINNTATRTFFVGDSTSPKVFNLKPAINTNFNNFSTVEVSANFTDVIGVGSIYANITLPNGTLYTLTLNNITEADYYNGTFSTTSLSGVYNITFIANDTANNLNNTETTNFSIGDITIPYNLTLNKPNNHDNASFSLVSFNFTVYDDLSTSLSCSLRLNNNIVSTSNTANGTLKNIQVSLADNAYLWNVTCTDQYSNSNTSESRTLRVDTLAPNFTSITTMPSSSESLDPGVNITAIAIVSDDIAGIDSIILQYRPNSTTTYTNITMAFNTANNYTATFNATDTGTYLMRLNSNDTLGNSDVSAEASVAVEYERSWTRNVDDFGAVIGTLNKNTTLGILIINNTGDFSLNFNITSDYNQIYYNQSENFTLASGSIYSISVNASRPTVGITDITFTINTTNGNPVIQTTTASLVVAPGQPVLVATFLTPASRNISVTQGDTGITFLSELNNTGQGNATNLTFYTQLPNNAGWTITSASGDNGNITNLDEPFRNGTSERNEVVVTIPNNASIGAYNVITNATGFNLSGTDLSNLGLIFGDVVTVTVNEKTTLGSSTPSIPGGGSTSTPAAGGGSSLGGSVSRKGTGEILYTTKSVEVVRGDEKGIPLTIENLYENAVLENVKLEVQGFSSQYVKITPIIDLNKKVYVDTRDITITKTKESIPFSLKDIGQHQIVVTEMRDDFVSIILKSEPIALILQKGNPQEVDIDNDDKNDIVLLLEDVSDGISKIKANKIGPPELDKIYFEEDREYKLEIFAPSYLEEEDVIVVVKITADIVAVNPEKAGFTSKKLTEFRTLVLKVLEIDIEEANTVLEKGRQNVNEMKKAGFPTTKVENLLLQAGLAFSKKDFSLLKELTEQISDIKRTAFEINEIVLDVKKGIERAKSRSLSVQESEKVLNLAVKAFEREDFDSALQRAKDAQLTLILETRGKLNIIWFLKTYWWAVILGIIALSILSFFTYKKLILSIISQRLKNLAKEETTINELVRNTQSEYLKQGIISSPEYKKTIDQYSKRLNKIKQIRSNLRSKRVGIIKTERELDSTEREEKEIISKIKKEQLDYLQKGKLSRKEFMDIYNSDKERLAEIEEEREILREKLEREKISRKYKLLKLIDNVYTNISNRLRKRSISKTIGIKGIKNEIPPIKKDKEELEGDEKKRYRKELYKRLKEEHGIDVQDPEDE